MKIIFSLIIVLSTLKVFGQKNSSMDWVAGTWKINTGRGSVVEKWKTVNDSTLIGKSMFVKAAGDSILQETLELARRKGQWTYTSTVQGQNNNQPVPFKVIFIKGTEFISENPTHDFPQRIAYRRIKNSLFASIEGKKNGKFDKQNFDFTTE